MRFPKTTIIIILALFVGYFIGTYRIKSSWQNFRPIVSVKPKTPPPGQVLDMTLFYDVLERVNRDHYDRTKIDAKKLLYGAISGALGSLQDPYTFFFPPKENESFKTQLSGQFEGIGAELGMGEDNRVIVVAPLDGSPAQKAKVKAGDKILEVDGDDTTGWTLPQAVEKIRGPKGTTVTLTVRHERQEKSTEIKIVRDVIKVKSVTSWVKNVECSKNTCRPAKTCQTCPRVAYIRVAQFGDKTNDEWTEAVNSIYSLIKNGKNVPGVILDLRNNPGGYLNDAVFIAGEFLEARSVVVAQEDKTGERTQLRVSRRGLLLDPALIVLVNRGSASASEIVSAALRDHRRAQIIGEKTFGKGTIQEAVDVDNGASVHISIAKWLTPKGAWLDKKGLEPDIKVEYDATGSAEMERTEEFDNQLQRAIQELLR